MPIIDISAPGIDAPIDTPKGFAVTPGKDDLDHGSEAPDFFTGAAAVFRKENPLTSFLVAEDRASSPVPETGFNAWETIKGTKYEPHWDSFVEVRNSAAADNMKRKIDRESEDNRLVGAMPWYQSLPVGMAAGVLDPSILLPGGAFVRGAKGGLAIGRTALNVAAGAGAQAAIEEGTLHATQETRTVGESAVNIGASVFLGGLLGAGGAKLLSKTKWNGAVAALEKDLTGGKRAAVSSDFMPSPEAVGAAAAKPMGIEGNTIAGTAANVLAESTRRLNPLLRLNTSPSPAAREISGQLFENSLYLKKNLEGIASEPAAETLMKEWNGGLGKAITSTDEAFSDYSKAGGAMSRRDFREAVGKAMRRSDEDADPFVSKVAKTWRAQVFEPLKEAAIKAKLLPEDVTVETAASYFSRMWNRNKLIAREGEFKGIVQTWLTRQAPRWAADFDNETITKSAKLKDDKLREYQIARRIEREALFDDVPGTVRGIADEVFGKLTGKAGEGVRPEFITVKARGPLKERTFSIPDHLVENFLEHDVDLVGRRYTRIMGADVELANKFGSVDMVEQLQKVRDDYAKLRSGITDEGKLKNLDVAEKADIRDLEAVRDLLRGTRTESPIERNYSRIIRSANHINYLRVMGEVSFASLSEFVRPAMVHGLMPYLGTIGKFATNIKAIKFSVAEAQLAGNVAERVLGHRLATIADIIDPYASRGPVEAFLENMTNIASKWNGIRLLTDMQKSISSVMTQDRLLTGSSNYAKAKPKEKSYMAFLGIDESMAGRISKQFSEHGETVEGVKVANTEKWTDPVAVRTYRAAINKDVDSIITTKGVADVPLFANTSTGKAMLQFKSFFLASHQRVLLRGLQEDQARFIGGTLAMTGIGMFATYLKAVSGNRQEKIADFATNPGWWVAEGLDRSGVFSVPMELANTLEKATGFNPIKSPIKAFDEGNRLSQRMQNRSVMGAIAGPSAGLIDDASSVAGIPKRMIEGEEITQGQKNAAERLIPFNSYFGVRQMLRYVVNPPE